MSSNKLTHFTSLSDWSNADLNAIIDTAIRLKSGALTSQAGKGKVLGLVFFNPSLRTKISFEVAAAHLGATTALVQPGQGSWTLETEPGAIMDGNKTEHVKEAIQVLSQYCDAIGVRAFSGLKDRDADFADVLLNRIREYATVPVINLESAMEHPCQGLADWMTIKELFPGGAKGKKLVLTWAPHPVALPVAVPNSVLDVASRSGIDVTLACPPEMLLSAETLERVKTMCVSNGSRFVVDHDQRRALQAADVVYAKSWASGLVYTDPEKEKSLRWETYRDWTLTSEKMALTNQAKFMHCLPVRRNVVVTDEVLDSPNAVHIQEAGNRLHVQKAILMKLWE